MRKCRLHGIGIGDIAAPVLRAPTGAAALDDSRGGPGARALSSAVSGND